MKMYPIYKIDFVVKDRGIEHTIKSMEVSGFNAFNAEYHLRGFYRKHRHAMDLSTKFQIEIRRVQPIASKSSELGVQNQ